MNPKIGQGEQPTVKILWSGHVPSGPAGRVQQNGLGRNAAPHPSPNQVDSTAQLQATDEWRRWIAENLLIDQAPDEILAAMRSAGFSTEESEHELKAAMDSPYVRGSELLRNRLKKRDWLLAASSASPLPESSRYRANIAGERS